MSATEDYESLHRLTGKQLAVIALLVSGSTHVEAAEATGVHRVTVSRWANHHPAFIARLNEIQSAVQRETRLSAQRITNAALRLVERSIAEDDVDAAFRWLRLAPQFTPPTGGPIESEAVVEQVRRQLPTMLDVLLMHDEPTVADASAEIARALAVTEED